MPLFEIKHRLSGEVLFSRATSLKLAVRAAIEINADLSGADLRRADLSRADLDMSAWPLSCGGTNTKIHRRLSLQLIYHAFNQLHDDPTIIEALEPLRALAEEFRTMRTDAPKLREIAKAVTE